MDDERDWYEDLITILSTRMIANRADREIVAPFIERWADERGKARERDAVRAALERVKNPPDRDDWVNVVMVEAIDAELEQLNQPEDSQPHYADGKVCQVKGCEKPKTIDYMLPNGTVGLCQDHMAAHFRGKNLKLLTQPPTQEGTE